MIYVRINSCFASHSHRESLAYNASTELHTCGQSCCRMLFMESTLEITQQHLTYRKTHDLHSPLGPPFLTLGHTRACVCYLTLWPIVLPCVVQRVDLSS